MATLADQLVFSYGTLQDPAVQLDTFGHLVPCDDDVLPGYTVDYVGVGDPRVVEVSGLAAHPIVRETGDPRDKVTGRVLRLTEDELEAADEYEVAHYRRVTVVLASGTHAFAYVTAGPARP
ncbi:gamma-glutamylcyclotransferase family protein [uncultured Microbacterium sp.]|uniref:gamma-glutamylcyclotransferase family protein n=1 Tax=uncultured Microbacterium sp. TaxID=191216 RepID=UPI0035CB7B29